MKLLQDKSNKKSVRQVGRDIYRLILFIFLVLGGALTLFAVAELVIGVAGYIRTRAVYDDANERFVSVRTKNTDAEEAEEEEDPDQDEIYEEESVSEDDLIDGEIKEIQVDLKALKEINDEIIGWLYFEDGLISYPILYSGDNDKYLKRNYKEEYMASGSIFMDKDGAPDFSDHYTLLYGHNMRDLTMFGKLRYYRTEKDYVKDHGYFRIITEDNEYRYEIFSCRQVLSESDVFSAIDRYSEGLAEFAKKELMGGSSVDKNIKISDTNHVLALSTCVNDYKYRYIVCGVRMDDEEEEIEERPEDDEEQDTVLDDSVSDDDITDDDASYDDTTDDDVPGDMVTDGSVSDNIIPDGIIPYDAIPYDGIPYTEVSENGAAVVDIDI